MAEAAKSMLNFLNIESIVVCCLRFNIYNTTTATDKRTQHRHHIGLNRISFSRSLESQDKVTKSIVFAPKLPRVGLNAKCDNICYATDVRGLSAWQALLYEIARVVFAWEGGLSSE